MSKTNVDKYIDNDTRNIYDSKVTNKSLEEKLGITEEVIREISKDKNEPD